MKLFKSDNSLAFSQIYNAVSPVDRMSHLSLLITYGAQNHSCILSQMFCDNYALFSSDTIRSLIKWLDIDAPYYKITDLGLMPTDKYETGSHHRWYYWPINAN